MQPIILQRYLGNKGKLINDILKVIETLARPGDLVFDAFSGTLAVSMALKQNGYRVISNDISSFSWVYGRSYLTNSSFPKLNLEKLGLTVGRESPWDIFIKDLLSGYSKEFPKKSKRTDFFDHYCEDGEKSSFESIRGTAGKRRFFSPENAILIDRALSKLRYYSETKILSELAVSFATSILISAVERVSNTQGTYHDFPRAFYDQRSLNRLQLVLPSLAAFDGRKDHILGKCQDTLEFVKGAPKHKVLYIDPPYNFRQYTSYYFLLNIISEYPYIKDLKAYFQNIQYVRGQNMEDDFKSSFCSTASFMPSLENLITDAKCKYVVMSYFDGKNHWSDFKEKGDERGFKTLATFFRGALFKKGSYKCVPVKRMNYQSYGGHKAEIVKEYLFIAEKR